MELADEQLRLAYFLYNHSLCKLDSNLMNRFQVLDLEFELMEHKFVDVV